jgi:hypothetical protein
MKRHDSGLGQRRARSGVPDSQVGAVIFHKVTRQEQMTDLITEAELMTATAFDSTVAFMRNSFSVRALDVD